MKSTVKNILVFFTPFFGLGLWIFALNSGPSQRDIFAAKKFMTEDMQAVIEVGGRVVNSYNDTKVSPGGSNFFVSLDSHSVSRPTIEKYHKELKNRGWIILDSLKDEYCKNGSRAAIFTEGKFRDIDVISISMAYDRDTVKRCSKT